MKNILLTLTVIAVIHSCNTSTKQTTESTTATISTDTVGLSDVQNSLSNPETAARNTEIAPVVENQFRVPGVKTQTPYKVEILNTNLGRPWGIIHLPDGRFLITEKSGFLNIVSADGLKTQQIKGLPPVDNKGQGGLLDVALDPDFETNRMIFWSFSEPVNGGNHTSVAKGKLSADETKIENPHVIFRALPVYDGDKHYGSRLIFDAQGNLFVSTGERSDMATRPMAQDNSTYLGKIIKIDKNGNSAVEKPRKGWQAEIYSTGHRNPQGTDIHPITGDLWVAEMGPKGGDEVNLVEPGKNYGWPIITYGEEYSGKKVGDGFGQKDGLEQPVYFWDPSVSPSGIAFYTGKIAEWKNNLMIGCLSGQKIIRLVIEDNKVTGEEWLLTDQNERIRDVMNGNDGNLYAITDSGKLLKISAE